MAPRVLGELGEPREGTPAPPDGGQHDEQGGQPEARNGQPEDGCAPGHVVAHGVLAGGRENAHRNRDEQRDHDGDEGELEGDGKPAPDLLDHRPLGPQGLPEVPPHGPARPLEVLDVQGATQPELLAQLLDVLGVGLFLEHELHHVARNEARQGEHDERGDEERGDGDEQPLDEIAPEQAGSCWVGGRDRPPPSHHARVPSMDHEGQRSSQAAIRRPP